MSEQRRELLLGLFAVQLQLLTSAALSHAVTAWSKQQALSFDVFLVENEYLTSGQVEMISEIADAAVAAHGGDIDAAIAALGGVSRVEDSFLGAITILGHGDFEVRSHGTGDEKVLGVEEAPGRYTHVSEYARGGMGRVLLAHDEHFGRDIALKELLPQFDPDAHTIAPNSEHTPVRLAVPLIARFLQEARITGQLEHPSIVPVYELGYRKNGTLYYTMKLVRGNTLARALSQAKSLEQRLGLLPHYLDLCQAVAYAHSKGVIHRDIKPSNVMVGEFGETVVIDWGLAKVLGSEDVHREELAQALANLNIDEQLGDFNTLHGQAIGTPSYMPPEQAAGEIDHVQKTSDVYSLGAVLYEILSGRPPYVGESGRAILKQVTQEDPASLDAIVATAPPELVAICTRAMMRAPDARYPDAQALAEDVRRFLAGAVVQAYSYSFAEHLRRFWKRHRGVLTASAVGAVALLVTGIVYNIMLVQARDREREQRIAAETANKQLIWENYAVTLSSAQKHMSENNFPRAMTMLADLPVQHRDWEWGRLHVECEPPIVTLTDANMGGGTFGFPCCLRVSPDSTRLLMHRSFSGIKHVYDIGLGKNVFVEKIGAPTGWPDCTKFMPDGAGFTTALGDSQVGLWDIASKEQRATYDAKSGEIRSIVIRADGEQLAGFVVEPNYDARIVVWERAGGEPIRTFPVKNVRIDRPEDANWTKVERYYNTVQGAVLDYFADGRRIAFFDQELGILDVNSGESTYVAPVKLVATFSPLTQLAVTISPDHHYEVWDLKNRVRLSRTPCTDFPRSIELSPQGDVFYLSPPVSARRVSDGVEIYRSLMTDFCPQISSNGRVLFTRNDQVFCAWDARMPRDEERIVINAEGRGASTITLDFPFGRQQAYAYNAAKTMLAESSDDARVRLWGVPAFTLRDEIVVGEGLTRAVAFSADGQLLAISREKSIVVVEVGTKKIVQSLRPAEGQIFANASISPDGKRLAVAAQLFDKDSDEGNDLAWVLDLQTGERVYTVHGHQGACNLAQFSPDGRFLLTGRYGAVPVSGAKSLCIWDAETGQKLLGEITSINWPWHVDFAPDNKTMLVLGLSRAPVLFDFETMRERYRIADIDARQVFFHPDGRRFAVIGMRGARILASDDGKELISMPWGKVPGYFTPDGTSLVFRENDESFRVLKSDAWHYESEAERFQAGLAEVRKLLALPRGD